MGSLSSGLSPSAFLSSSAPQVGRDLNLQSKSLLPKSASHVGTVCSIMDLASQTSLQEVARPIRLVIDSFAPLDTWNPSLFACVTTNSEPLMGASAVELPQVNPGASQVHPRMTDQLHGAMIKSAQGERLLLLSALFFALIGYFWNQGIELARPLTDARRLISSDEEIFSFRLPAAFASCPSAVPHNEAGLFRASRWRAIERKPRS